MRLHICIQLVLPGLLLIGCKSNDEEKQVTQQNCQSTGEVDGYSWSEGTEGVLNGRSILEMFELDWSLLDLESIDPCQIVTMFDYPGSRDPVDKKYEYTYEKDIKRPTRVGSGLTLTGLDAPTEGAWGSYVKDEYFRVIADAGFEMVRIPFRFSLFISGTNPVAVNEEFLTRVNRAIDKALENGLKVSLAIFYFPNVDTIETFINSDEKDEKLKQLYGLWDILADRFKDYSENLYFELLNDPHLPLTYEIWNDALEQLIVAVRATGGNNATRKLVVSPAGWSHLGMLQYLDIPFSDEEDPNLIVKFHYYEPYSFTYQGVDWGPLAMFGAAWLGNVWTGTDYQKELIRQDLDLAAQWSQSHNRPILLDEFGVRHLADKQSRITYLKFVREEAEKRDIPWLAWTFNINDSFGFYDPELGWQTEVLDVLVPKAATDAF
jgi:endoglucanase